MTAAIPMNVTIAKMISVDPRTRIDAWRSTSDV